MTRGRGNARRRQLLGRQGRQEGWQLQTPTTLSKLLRARGMYHTYVSTCVAEEGGLIAAYTYKYTYIEVYIRF